MKRMEPQRHEGTKRNRRFEDVIVFFSIAIGTVLIVLAMSAGCVVSKPVIRVDAAGESHHRDTESTEKNVTVVINAGAGLVEKSAVTGDNVTTGTMTVTAESGSGGAGGWIGAVWGMVREWFGVGGR